MPPKGNDVRMVAQAAPRRQNPMLLVSVPFSPSEQRLVVIACEVARIALLCSLCERRLCCLQLLGPLTTAAHSEPRE
eukprot:6716328-Prymnesium_polylepis.1